MNDKHKSIIDQLKICLTDQKDQTHAVVHKVLISKVLRHLKWTERELARRQAQCDKLKEGA